MGINLKGTSDLGFNVIQEENSMARKKKQTKSPIKSKGQKAVSAARKTDAEKTIDALNEIQALLKEKAVFEAAIVKLEKELESKHKDISRIQKKIEVANNNYQRLAGLIVEEKEAPKAKEPKKKVAKKKRTRRDKQEVAYFVGQLEEEVLKILKVKPQGAGTEVIKTNLEKLHVEYATSDLKAALKNLQKNKKIRKEGERRATVYFAA